MANNLLCSCTGSQEFVGSKQTLRTEALEHSGTPDYLKDVKELRKCLIRYISCAIESVFLDALTYRN